MTAPGDLAKRMRTLAKKLRVLWGPNSFAGDCADAADALDRLATVEAERGEYLTQARIAEQMRQTATVERDAAYALQVEAFEQFEAERARAVCAEAHRDRCAAVLLQREAEIEDLDRALGKAEADSANAEAAYTVEHGLLVEWRIRASAAEAIADAAREYVAARNAGQFYPEYPTMAMLIEQGESSGERAKDAYAALVAAVEAKP